MALAPGTKVGPYEILAQIGAGGMGVVWKARDTRLDRFVAIKILRADATGSPERKRRFVQEAKAASALNHPNILHVYDIEIAGDLDFIAMEYVEGKTLGDLIGRKGMPIRELLKWATQLADGLAAAHAAGIVHRDIKPGNLMANEQGLVKILDFGLAKLTDRAESDHLGTTETMGPRTEEGAIIGTVAYMSPEQAEGMRVDFRSDIFSFGSVLYEMATGVRAFHGQTKMSTMSAILQQNPRPPREIVPALPYELERIISHCLRKDPNRRFQHIEDVKTLLERLREELESGQLASVRPTEGPISRFRWTPAVVGVGLSLLAAAVIVRFVLGGYFSPRGTPVLSQVTRLTHDAGLTTDPDLSPDGRLLVYSSDRASPATSESNLDIWVQQIAGGDPIQLTRDPADDHEPAFSPDGTQIAFRSERNGGGIYVIPTLGGEERLIAPDGRRPRFSPDGQWIAYWTGRPVSSVGVEGGRVFAVRATGGPPVPIGRDLESPCFPVWSPDGQRVLVKSGGEFSAHKWWVVPQRGGVAVEAASDGFFASHDIHSATPLAWLRDPERIVFVSVAGESSSLWVAAIAPGAVKLVGTPHRLTLGTGAETAAAVALLGNGAARLVFSSRSFTESVWTLPIDAGRGIATAEPARLTTGISDSQPLLAANGRILFFNSVLSLNPRDWVEDLSSGKKATLTTMQYEQRPVPTADGSRVAYQAKGSPNSKLAIYGVDLTWQAGKVPQPGVPFKISRLDSEDCGWPWSWSSNGKQLLYNCPIDGPVRMYDSESGENKPVLGERIYGLSSSPNGLWIAFFRSDRVFRKARLFVAPSPFDGRAVSEQDWIPVTGDEEIWGTAGWSADGRLVYFVSGRDGFACIWAQRLDPFTKKTEGEPFPVYHAHASGRSLSNVGGYDQAISATHDRIAFVLGEQTGSIWMAKWQE